MHSGEGEKVPFSERLYPTGNVEDWLLEVERVMKSSLKDILFDALQAYHEVIFQLTLVSIDMSSSSYKRIELFTLHSN